MHTGIFAAKLGQSSMEGPAPDGSGPTADHSEAACRTGQGQLMEVEG